MNLSLQQAKSRQRYFWGLLVWALGWGLMWVLGGHLDVGNVGLLLVLTSAVAAVWLPISVTLTISLASLLGFNWAFVPPRHTFTIDIEQHAILLTALLAVNGIVAGLMVSLRDQSRRALRHAAMADQLRTWGDKLRDVSQPHLLLAELQATLSQMARQSVALIALREQLPEDNQSDAIECFGSLTGERLEGLWYCLRNGQSLGPGTGRYEELADIYLPMRGREMSYGAVAAGDAVREAAWRDQAQALCDQMGAALERHRIWREERRTREEVQAHSLRTTLLAAISHDYRTPLATIMGAASSIEQQAGRFTESQLKTLARGIVDEAGRLRRPTDNILQLARLDQLTAAENGPLLRCDWESAEEIIGSVVRRMRPVAGARAITVKIATATLLWCDSVLIAQLLENLLDNALKYSPPETAVSVCAFAEGEQLVLAVDNQGPAIPPANAEQIFTLFYRGKSRSAGGAGIGLALCRAIARAHAGELSLISGVAGTRFECRLPVKTQPPMPERETGEQS